MKLPVIHIGYPKTASTTLQNMVFQRHEGLLYLGRGVSGSMIDYIDGGITAMAEIDLKFRRDASLDREKSRQLIDKYKAIADEAGKTLVYSSEYLSIDWPSEIDLSQKVERLAYFFRNQAQIIMVTREQYSWLFSFYKELIRQGYTETYQEFIYWVWQKQDRNMLPTLNFAHVKNLYEEHFGRGNVHVLPFELFHNHTHHFAESLSAILNVSISDDALINKDNAAFSDNHLNVLRELNKRYHHTVMAPTMLGYHDFFASDYYVSELGLKSAPIRSLVDEQLRTALHDVARRFDAVKHTLSQDIPNDLREKLKKYFVDGNLALQEQVDFDLKALGYAVDNKCI